MFIKYFRLTQNPFILFRWPAMGIHGDKSQQERDWVLNGKLKSTVHLCQQLTQNIFITSNLYFVHFSEFKYGKAPILIATDVASRGLGQYPP